MEEFDFISTKMSNNYNKLENVMANIYHQMQDDPKNEQLRNLLGELGDIAEGMLNQQIDFTEVYCSPDVKGTIIGNLYSKKEALASALGRDLSSKTK